MTQEFFIGLDVGTTKVAAVVGRQDLHNKLEVLAAASVPSCGVGGGRVEKIDKTTEAIVEVIKRCEEQMKEPNREASLRVVNVNISGQHIIQSLSRQGSITRANREEEIGPHDLRRLFDDMHKIALDPGWDVLHVYPCGYRVDYDEKITHDPKGMLGGQLEGFFTLVCVETEAIRRLVKCVQRAGLEIAQTIIDPMASSLSVLSDEEREAGACLVDVGGATTDVIVFREGMVRHVAVIPYGACLLTEDLRKGCSILRHQAEKLKIDYGHALEEGIPHKEVVSVPGINGRPPKEFSVKNIAAILQCRMEEIIEAVDEEIIRSGHAESLPAGLVVTGGGAQLRGAKDLFEYVTGYDTRIGAPTEHLGLPGSSSARSPELATAVGLVLSGMRLLDEEEAPHVAMDKKEGGGLLKKILHRTKGIFLEDMDDRIH